MAVAAQNFSSQETEVESLINKGRYLSSYISSQHNTNCKRVDDKKFMCYCSEGSTPRCISVFRTLLRWHVLNCCQDNNLRISVCFHDENVLEN